MKYTPSLEHFRILTTHFPAFKPRKGGFAAEGGPGKVLEVSAVQAGKKGKGWREGGEAQKTVARVRRAAAVMMLTRQANGMATAASSSTTAPACLPERHRTLCTHMHIQQNTHPLT